MLTEVSADLDLPLTNVTLKLTRIYCAKFWDMWFDKSFWIFKTLKFFKQLLRKDWNKLKTIRLCDDSYFS